ncbi:MAG: radical SAM protein [Spirochaetaceae bacterium]
MFFKLKSNVMFRNYESFGYITDNRNFGYKLENTEDNNIGDKIISQSGSLFYSVLDKKPQSLDELTAKIYRCFKDIDFGIILNDSKEFYFMLERDGFIISGETQDECIKKDIKFSYKKLKPEILRNVSKLIEVQQEKLTQDFFEEYFKGKPQLTSIHMEIISKCNERCIHCYIPHDKKVNVMESDLFYDILEQCKKMKLLHITITGGEPMMHKNFCNFLRKCNEYGFSVNVLSNLTLLNEEIITEIKQNPLLGVQVSLYSMDSSIHDEITQVTGSFEKTTKSILKLIENDIPLQISCPILKQNKNCYDNVRMWAQKHKIHVGADFVIFGKYDNNTENLSNRLSIDEIGEVITEISNKDINYLDQLKKEAEEKKDISANDKVCSICHSSLCISENGIAYPCAGWQGYILGNLNETSLNEIWTNSNKIEYLRGLCKNDFHKCLKCSDKEYCTMCMVRNANEHPNGDPLVVNDFFCNIAKLNKKIVLERNILI